MRYYLDTEFNEFGGELISLALVSERDERELYLAREEPHPGEWVRRNVIPVLIVPGAEPNFVPLHHFGHYIARYLRHDPDPIIVADWPDDIRYLCATLIVDPGEMVAIKRLTFEMVRVHAYPSTLPGAVQHNALWDARALRHVLTVPNQ